MPSQAMQVQATGMSAMHVVTAAEVSLCVCIHVCVVHVYVCVCVCVCVCGYTFLGILNRVMQNGPF